MNIIANDCTGGFIYRDILSTSYKNPFIFSRTFLDDFIYLLKHFNELNFTKFNLCESTPFKYYIRVDDAINIQYNHYKFDPTAAELRKEPPNVYYSKIWEYIVNKYIERTRRMTEPPIFIGHFDYGQLGEWDPTMSIDKVNSFVNLCHQLNQPALILSELPIESYDSDTVKIVRFKRIKLDGNRYVHIVDVLRDEIVNKLQELSDKVRL